jgi:hypothetical protein
VLHVRLLRDQSRIADPEIYAHCEHMHKLAIIIIIIITNQWVNLYCFKSAKVSRTKSKREEGFKIDAPVIIPLHISLPTLVNKSGLFIVINS